MGEMKMFLVAQDLNCKLSCGCCNWRVQNLYLMGNSEEEAVEEYKVNVQKGGSGLCGDCMCQLQVDEKYEITPVAYQSSSKLRREVMEENAHPISNPQMPSQRARL